MARRDVLYALAAGALMHGVYLGGVFWAVREELTAGLSALIVGLAAADHRRSGRHLSRRGNRPPLGQASPPALPAW